MWRRVRSFFIFGCTMLAIVSAYLMWRSFSVPVCLKVGTHHGLGLSVERGQAALFYCRTELTGAEYAWTDTEGFPFTCEFDPNLTTPVTGSAAHAWHGFGATSFAEFPFVGFPPPPVRQPFAGRSFPLVGYTGKYGDIRFPMIIAVAATSLPALLSLFFALNKLRRTRDGSKPCPHCGYDLRSHLKGATDATCPECGNSSTAAPPQRTSRRALRLILAWGVRSAFFGNFVVLTILSFMLAESWHWNREFALRRQAEFAVVASQGSIQFRWTPSPRNQAVEFPDYGFRPSNWIKARLTAYPETKEADSKLLSFYSRRWPEAESSAIQLPGWLVLLLLLILPAMTLGRIAWRLLRAPLLRKGALP